MAFQIEETPIGSTIHASRLMSFTMAEAGAFILMQMAASATQAATTFTMFPATPDLLIPSKQKSGTFCASKMGRPLLSTGLDFELPCRVYRLEDTGTEKAE